MPREAQLDLPLLYGAPLAQLQAATVSRGRRTLPTWHPEMGVDAALQLEAAAERGDWEAMKRIPFEEWPWPYTPAMEETLRSLPREQKLLLIQVMNANRAAEGLPGHHELDEVSA